MGVVQMEKKLAAAANVAILVVAISTVVMLVRNEITARKHSAIVTQGSVNPAILVGKQFPITQHWTRYAKTVVLALSVGCHFCSASAPFYKQLTAYAGAHRANVVALLPQTKDESSHYVEALGLSIPAIQQVNFGDIDVVGTPTLFLVDSNGVVQKVWQGQLQTDQQREVLSLLG
jgi:hypothetical protein